MDFKRVLNLTHLKHSTFLFGPRMTGKTTLLRKLNSAAYLNLLDLQLELLYRENPKVFWEEISALKPGSKIIIDEIQKIPSLLNYVQMGIDQLQHQFILSGSSARKLKRGGANLLGGRALDLKLHPLSFEEMGKFTNLDHVLSCGSLPKIYSLVCEKDLRTAKDYLRTYVSTYLKEEIQMEALTRNLGAFQRFLAVASQSNGQVIEFANISRECSVPMTTVKEYYSILEDTLIGNFLWPYDRNERKKARPKFYFFDCGVTRALQSRLNDLPTPSEKGFLFETWFYAELRKIRDYQHKDHEIGFWRSRTHEVDFVISSGRGPILAVECKTSQQTPTKATLGEFQKRFPKVPLLIASAVEEKKRKLDNGLVIYPWKEALKFYKKF